MPTLTATPRARAAAVQRGLTDLQTEANRTPVSEVRISDVLKSEPVEPEPPIGGIPENPPNLAEPSNKRARARAEHIARQRAVRDHLWPLLSARFPLAFCLPAKPLPPQMQSTRASCRPSCGIGRGAIRISGPSMPASSGSTSTARLRAPRASNSAIEPDSFYGAPDALG
jgi:hypothetical protein